MTTEQTTPGEVSVENVGGIDEASVKFQPGITVLEGRNATNRTSLLRAIMAALGSDQGSLKADADAGQVRLEFDGETYTRTFERGNGGVVTGGDPYLDDPEDVELAGLFAFLLETNEARRTVVRGDDLREVIMRPVDTVAIKSEIDDAMRDRNRIDDKLAELDELADELPLLEQRRQSLKDNLDEVESDLAAKREALKAAERRVDETEESAGDEAMAELDSVQETYNRTRRRLETERDSHESLEAELEELQFELEELPEPAELEDAEHRIEQLRERQSRLDTVVTELQSIVEFNEKLLEGSGDTIQDLLKVGDAATTDELLPAAKQETVCLTCGSAVQYRDIEDTIERLHTVREETLAERSEVRAEIDELTTKQREQRERREERERLEGRIERTETELAERRERIEELKAEQADLEERIDELEAEVTEIQDEEEDELLGLNRDVNEQEFERDRLKSELTNVTDDIEEIESRLEEREALESDREAVTERLQELRERIDRIERGAVESFNEHMAEVLDVLEYENLERIWINRHTDTDPSRFELKIVRSMADGTVHEDTLDHLSESEREVTGLVFALAGYLVHEVYETVPLMILDSIEAVDSERIARLLKYFSGYTEVLVVALLSADAAAVDDEYHYVSEI